MILLTGWQKLSTFVFNLRSRVPKLGSDIFGCHEGETKFSWLVWRLVIWTSSNFGFPTFEGQTNCEEIGIRISYWPTNYISVSPNLRSHLHQVGPTLVWLWSSVSKVAITLGAIEMVDSQSCCIEAWGLSSKGEII
jgi:hypothetical protein